MIALRARDAARDVPEPARAASEPAAARLSLDLEAQRKPATKDLSSPGAFGSARRREHFFTIQEPCGGVVAAAAVLVRRAVTMRTLAGPVTSSPGLNVGGRLAPVCLQFIYTYAFSVRSRHFGR